MMHKIKNPLLVGARQGASKNAFKQANHTLNHHCSKSKNLVYRLPDPISYYQTLFPSMRVRNNIAWISVNCCFHEDSNPSLRLNIQTGAFRCFGCGAKGGSIIAFQMQHQHMSFQEALSFLGGQL